MFNKKQNATESMLDAEIIAALGKMEKIHDKTSEDYATLLERVSELSKLKAEQKPKQVSPDTVLIVTANIIGIMSIIHHEKLHPITSKAMNFVAKPW